MSESNRDEIQRLSALFEAFINDVWKDTSFTKKQISYFLTASAAGFAVSADLTFEGFVEGAKVAWDSANNMKESIKKGAS